MARGEIIGFGIIFLIIAVMGYGTPISVTLADTTVNLTIPKVVAFCDSGLGQLAQMSLQVAMVCSEYNNFMMGIYGSGLLGIILIIVGAIYTTKKSIYFCDHCKFAASTEAELYNHSVKEHNDESRSAGEIKKEDESTFKYKDEEIQPETHSQKALPEEPKSDLKKSPTQKGTIIAIIAALIVVIVIIGYVSESPPQTTQQETTELNTNKESTPQQKTSPQTTQSDCDPNYSGVCIPVDSGDLDCSDFSRSFRVVGLDHHQLDRDGDGIACE